MGNCLVNVTCPINYLRDDKTCAAVPQQKDRPLCSKTKGDRLQGCPTDINTKPHSWHQQGLTMTNILCAIFDINTTQGDKDTRVMLLCISILNPQASNNSYKIIQRKIIFLK